MQALLEPAAADAAVDDDLAVKVLRQLRVMLHAMKSHFHEVERITGVGGAQVWALSVIHDRPGIGVGELARSLGIRQPTASIFVRNLVRLRLIRAPRAPSDRRSVRLHVLPEGEALLRMAPQPFSGVLPGALASLDQPCLQRLHADLARVISQLGEATAGHAVPLD